MATIALFAVWSATEQQASGERKALGEARLLSEEMAAVWDYVDAMQPYINYDAEGRYDFKGVYCSVAGKAIALRFTRSTDCTIRYVRESPRTPGDAPDEFEAAALASFADGASEYYGVSDFEGSPSLRYVSVLTIKHGCLSCHGKPAGAADDTGYPKEGMDVGDVAGAVSIAIPMASYNKEVARKTISYVLLFVVLTLAIGTCVALAFRRLVSRPLSQLSATARRMAEQDFGAHADTSGVRGEIAELAEDFNEMQGRLKDSYALLESRVERRTAELAFANERLREESDYKSRFLATMSHELRTPLTAINAYANVWLREESCGESEHRMLDGILYNSRSLLEIVNNVLDTASIEAGRFTLEPVPVDLLDLAAAVASLAEPLAQERGIAFTLDVPDDLPLVVADPSVLHKIATNLVGNALKFTDSGGSVRLSLAFDAAAGILRLDVTDTGVGISEKDQQVIFERFRQADSSTSRAYGGSGLGLALVKELAELSGGSVCVDSAPGRGSTFSVEVPCTAVEEG